MLQPELNTNKRDTSAPASPADPDDQLVRDVRDAAGRYRKNLESAPDERAAALAKAKDGLAAKRLQITGFERQIETLREKRRRLNKDVSSLSVEVKLLEDGVRTTKKKLDNSKAKNKHLVDLATRLQGSVDKVARQARRLLDHCDESSATRLLMERSKQRTRVCSVQQQPRGHGASDPHPPQLDVSATPSNRSRETGDLVPWKANTAERLA